MYIFHAAYNCLHVRDARRAGPLCAILIAGSHTGVGGIVARGAFARSRQSLHLQNLRRSSSRLAP
jgi:hypothetical protein